MKVAVKEFKLDICYSRNIEQRSRDCLVSAVFGTTGVFGDPEECPVCWEVDMEPKRTCSVCGKSLIHNHCFHGSSECPLCRGEVTSTEKSSRETQFLVTQYQRCEGSECSVSVLIELYNNDKQEMMNAVNCFDQIAEDTARLFHGYVHRNIACTACLSSTSSLLTMTETQLGMIADEKEGSVTMCQKCQAPREVDDLQFVEEIRGRGNFRNFEKLTLKKKEDIFLEGALKMTKSVRTHFMLRGRLCRTADFDQIVQHLREEEKMVILGWINRFHESHLIICQLVIGPVLELELQKHNNVVPKGGFNNNNRLHLVFLDII